MAVLNLNSPPQRYNTGQNQYKSQLFVSGGSVSWEKFVTTSPSGYLEVDLVPILSAHFSYTTSPITISYTVSFGGSTLDTGTFSYSF